MTDRRWIAAVLVAAPLAIAIAWLSRPSSSDAPPVDVENATHDSPEPESAASGRRDDGSSEPLRREAAPASSPDGSTAVVHGRVVDASGTPIANALVGDAHAARPTRTDDSGAFAVPVPPGESTVVLLVLSDRHAPCVAKAPIAEGARVTNVGDLELTPGGSIHGHVTDGSGAAIRDAAVTARLLTRDGWPSTVDVDALFGDAMTDARGAYAFDHLAPGAYLLSALADGMQSARSGVLVVRDGSDLEVEPIVLDTGHRLTGRVVDIEGEPIEGAAIRIRNDGGGARYRGDASTDATGRFEANALPPGLLRLEVSRAGFLGTSIGGVNPTATEELVVRLEPGLRIAGSVVDAATGRPVERFSVSARRIGDLEPANLGTMAQQLERRIDSMRAEADTATSAAERERHLSLVAALESRLQRVRREAMTQPIVVPDDTGTVADWPEGRFSVEGLEEGVYAVGIDSPAHRFAQIRPVELRRGGSAEDLTFLLHPGRTLSGRVVSRHDGEPVADAEVSLVRVLEPLADRPAEPRSAHSWAFARPGPLGVPVMSSRSDGDGRFSLRQAPPGRHVITVRHARTADFESEPFDTDASTGEFLVEVGARCSLSGHVAGALAGEAGAIRVLLLGGHGAMQTTDVDATGAYAFHGLQPGGYVVRAFAADADRYVDRLIASIFPLHSGAIDPDAIPPCDVVLSAGEHRTHDVRVEQPPRGRVEGTVSINGRAGEGRVILRPIDAPGSGGLSARAVLDERGGFVLSDVPVGTHALSVYGPTGSELHREEVEVDVDSPTLVAVDTRAGGVSGTVTRPDLATTDELVGYVWILPGAREVPADPYEYRRSHRVHRLRVRDGRFEDASVTAGPAVVILDLRGRRPASRTIDVPAGSSIELHLVAGAQQ